MSSIQGLPNKPNINDYNLKDDAQMLQYQEASQQYNRILTMITQQKSEEAATKSNLDKARHDAVMSIVSNIKG
ncbi:MAG: hypothetical protein ABJA66_08410 [Actinomycetota bacterium]